MVDSRLGRPQEELVAQLCGYKQVHVALEVIEQERSQGGGGGHMVGEAGAVHLAVAKYLQHLEQEGAEISWVDCLALYFGHHNWKANGLFCVKSNMKGEL